MRIVVLAFPIALALAACSKDKPAGIADASASAPVTSSATDSGLTSAPLPPSNLRNIPERFMGEAANRPTGTPRVEDVIDAFKKQGAEIRDQRQHLASSFLAMYCMGLKTGKDIHISICEYKDEATATAGRDMSLKAFGTAKRDIYINKATTLTMRRGEDPPEDQALAKKLVDTFAKVPPATTPPPKPSQPPPTLPSAIPSAP